MPTDDAPATAPAVADGRPPAARRWRLPARDLAWVAVVLVALSAALAATGWTWRLDRVLYDAALTVAPGGAPPDIVIVAIDDDSLAAIGRWPWRRAVHATLLERLAAARPRAIALDLVFSEPDADPAQDALLADALERAAPVVLPLPFRVDTLGRLQPLAPALPRSPAGLRLGLSEATTDDDGVLRHAFLRAGPPGHLLPHLAVQLLEAGGEQVPASLAHDLAPQDDRLPPPSTLADGWARDGRVGIRFRGPAGTVERVSYVDVLAGRVPAARLAGRYVLVGVTAQGLGDAVATPLGGPYGTMPGIEVLAQVLDTLRRGDAIVSVGPLGQMLGAALVVFVVMTGLRHGSPRAALVRTGLALVAALAASALLLREAGWWWPPAPAALAAALAYPLWSWRRLEHTVQALDAEIARLAAEPPEHVGAPAAADVPDPDPLDARLERLQRTGELVRAARRGLADVLATLPAAVVVADTGGRVRLANDRAAALFEVDAAAELIDLDLPRLLGEFRTEPPVDWPAALAALTPGGASTVVEGISPAGPAGALDCVLHVAAVDLQQQRRWVLTVTDITPVKQAERARDEVLAFVSHDLRAPAQAIALLADMNLDGRLQTPREALLPEVRRLASQTLSLSDDFVRATQVGQQPLSLEPVVPSALLAELQADWQPAAAAAGLALVTALDADVPSPLRLDRRLVARALGNLVGNALRHGAGGARVTLRLAWAPPWLHARVRDHGPGLSAADLVAVSRGDALRPGHARGLGLGLAFAQRVARRHGGRLVARAPEDGAGGVEFDLILKPEPAPERPGPSHPSQPSEPLGDSPSAEPGVHGA